MITITVSSKDFQLPEGITVIGRGGDADIRIDSTKLSRSHARFTVERNTLAVEDLDSRNGTFVNGNRIKGKVSVSRNDTVQIADLEVTIRYSEARQPLQKKSASKADRKAARASRAQRAMIKKVVIIAVVAVIALGGLSYFRNYVSPELKAVREELENARKTIDIAAVEGDLKKDRETKLALTSLKSSLSRVNADFEEEHKDAAAMINEIQKKLEELDISIRTLEAFAGAEALYNRIVARIESRDISPLEGVRQLKQLASAHTGDPVSRHALKKAREVEGRVKKEEESALKHALADAEQALKGYRFKEAVGIINACSAREFALLTPEDLGGLDELKKKVLKKAEDHLTEQAEDAVRRARTGDCEALKKELESLFTSIGFESLKPRYKKAVSDIDRIKAERIARAREKVQKELEQAEKYEKKRLYVKAKTVYEQAAARISEEELKKDIHQRLKRIHILLHAKNAVIDHIVGTDGFALEGVGFIAGASHDFIRLRIDSQEMDLGWDRIRDSEFLKLLIITVKRRPNPELFLAIALIVVDTGDPNAADPYLEEAASLSPEVKDLYSFLYTAYEQRIALRKQEEEKRKKDLEEKHSVKTVSIKPRKARFYVAPNGNDGHSGSITQPFATIGRAVQMIQPGQLIYVRGGTYHPTDQVHFRKEGRADAYIEIAGYPGEDPIIDGGNLPGAKVTWKFSRSKYWKITGPLHLTNGRGAGISIERDCEDLIFDMVEASYNGKMAQRGGHGFHVIGQRIKNILFKNCDAHHNANHKTIPGEDPVPNIYQHGDGWRIFDGINVKLIGCRAWRNMDDAYDFTQARDPIEMVDCWAAYSGIDDDEGSITGTPNWARAWDGDGFKLGYKGDTGQHITIRCISWGNYCHGWNVAGGPYKIYNCVAFQNGGSAFAGCDNQSSDMRNNVEFSNRHGSGGQRGRNSKFSASSGHFVTIKDTGVFGPRQADGSLPETNFMLPKPGSSLIDKGDDVGIPYEGRAPDIGAREYGLKTLSR